MEGGGETETARLCTQHSAVNTAGTVFGTLLCVCTVLCVVHVARVRCATLCFALLRVASRRLPRYSHTSLVGEPRRLRVQLRGVRERRKSADVHTVRSRCVYAVVHVVTQFLFARGE